MCQLTRPVFAMVAAALGGCGNGDAATAVQLVLTPDADSSSPAEMLAEIARLEVIVDAPGGLGGVDAEGPLPGEGTALDWDDDGQLEVRFAGPPLGDALPVLEIGLSANADRDLRFRVLGYPQSATRVVGAGGAEARVAPGEVRRVGVPFSLAPWARPPRVLLVLPAQGVKAPAVLAEVNAVLSTTVRPESLPGNVRLLDPLGRSLRIAPSVETLVVSDSTFGQQERSLLVIAFAEPLLHEGDYRVEIGPGLQSSAGRAFDQDAGTAGEQGFSSSFYYKGAEAGGGEPCEQCPPGYGCRPSGVGCAPLLSCSGLCPGGQVCDAGQQQCVEDCRVSGFCLHTARTCDPASGLCRDAS